ncbi:MAG: dihydroneopterin aldolase [Armatimonadetes bacterium]|nr:dihydroneopterin aldolase [Armatimonadota bacterium]
MVQINLVGLEFYGHHGLTEEERATGGRYRANINLRLAKSASVGETDMLEDTIDYVAVGTLIQETSDANQCKTVERLVSLCLDAILARFPAVRHAVVRIAKLHPPTSLRMDSFEVESYRGRHDEEEND